MVCPKCFGDYLDGVNVCVACHVLLVKDASRESALGKGRLVHFITYFSRREALAGKNLLECFGVEAIVSVDEIRGVRLWIHREDRQKAVKIFQENSLTDKVNQNTH